MGFLESIYHSVAETIPDVKDSPGNESEVQEHVQIMMKQATSSKTNMHGDQFANQAREGLEQAPEVQEIDQDFAQPC